MPGSEQVISLGGGHTHLVDTGQNTNHMTSKNFIFTEYCLEFETYTCFADAWQNTNHHMISKHCHFYWVFSGMLNVYIPCRCRAKHWSSYDLQTLLLLPSAFWNVKYVHTLLIHSKTLITMWPLNTLPFLLCVFQNLKHVDVHTLSLQGKTQISMQPWTLCHFYSVFSEIQNMYIPC